MDIKNYIQENETRFLDELFSLLRIPSISSESEHKGDMVRCAERWKELIMAAGADQCEVYPTEGNPIVVGQKMVDPNAKTVLVYGHYDVMPVDPIDLWNTEPFEPVIKDGKIWGRGADDDKGQSFMHAKAFEYMVKSGNLKCNVKFMLEGEEEIGSTQLYSFCEEHKDLLKCDVILVSDTGMIATDTPSITAGLRGLCNMILKPIMAICILSKSSVSHHLPCIMNSRLAILFENPFCLALSYQSQLSTKSNMVSVKFKTKKIKDFTFLFLASNTVHKEHLPVVFEL